MTMAYTTEQSVMALTGCTTDITTVGVIIAEAEREIDEFLVDVNLMTIPSPAPRAVQLAALYLSSSKVLYRQKHDGSQPNVIRAGNYYENVTVDKTAELYESKAWKLLRGYVLGGDPSCGSLIKTSD